MSNAAPAVQEVEVHALGAVESDRTLCGDTFEGDSAIGLAMPVFVEVGQRVTCVRCRTIIADCISLYTPNFKRRA